MKLLTRQEIIDVWTEQNKKYLDSFCCPSCRSLLVQEKEDNPFILLCENLDCDIEWLEKEPDNSIIIREPDKNTDKIKYDANAGWTEHRYKRD